jgi:hypothetical protein
MTTKHPKTRVLPFEHLSETPFMGRLLQATSVVIGAKKTGGDPPVSPQAEQYFHEVLGRAMNLAYALDRAERAIRLMGRLPNRSTYRDCGISREVWIRYHFDVYVVTMNTVYDCALLLASATFSLGLAPRVCKNDTVAENRRLVGSTVPAALKRLGKILSVFSGPRHQVVHRAERLSFGGTLEECLLADGLADLIEHTSGGHGATNEYTDLLAHLRHPMRDNLLRQSAKRCRRLCPPSWTK